MGSGNDNRKDNDAPIIRRPKLSVTNSEVKSDVAGSVADSCVQSFDVLVNSKLAAANVPVSLITIEGNYFVSIGSEAVAKVSLKRSEMLKQCLDLGVRYSGKIVDVNGKLYARFFRVTE